MTRFLLFVASITFVFHSAQWHFHCVSWHQRGRNMGCYSMVTGPVEQLTDRLIYDDASGQWEVQEGALLTWNWLPLHDGDVLTIDDAGVVTIKGLAA